MMQSGGYINSALTTDISYLTPEEEAAVTDSLKTASYLASFENANDPTFKKQNDTDDIILRSNIEAGEPVQLIYSVILPEDGNAAKTEMLVQMDIEGQEELYTIETLDLNSTEKGQYLRYDWTGKSLTLQYYNELDNQTVKDNYKGTLKLTLKITGADGNIYESEPHEIEDLIYKYRPEIYLHEDEFSGPVDVGSERDKR